MCAGRLGLTNLRTYLNHFTIEVIHKTHKGMRPVHFVGAQTLLARFARIPASPENFVHGGGGWGWGD